MNRSRRHGRPLADQRGSAGVEFALILPLMSVLLFGFFEAGRAFYTYNIASAAARDAARFAARLSMGCPGVSGKLASAADEVRIKTLAVTGDASAGKSPLIQGLTTNDISITYVCVANAANAYSGVYEDVPSIPTVTVTVNAPFKTILQSLLPGLSIDGLSVSHSETWTE